MQSVLQREAKQRESIVMLPRRLRLLLLLLLLLLLFSRRLFVRNRLSLFVVTLAQARLRAEC